jgi:asparagine synthase (glutamine-hydrolysing)
MLEAVKKLEPGCFLRVFDGKVVKRSKFYDFPYNQEVRWDLTREEAAELVREGLERAVIRQLVSDAPLGAFLSGGLDSSSIVAMAVKHTRAEDFNCFTISTPESKMEGYEDDLPFARHVAELLRVRLHVIDAEPELMTHLPFMVYHLDEPEADPAAILVYLMSRLASQQGVKVLLSGTGGDDVFAGYRRHRAAMLEPYWSWLPAGLRGFIGHILRSGPQGRPLFRRLRKAFQFAEASEITRLIGYYIWTDPSWERTIYSQQCKSQFHEDTINSVLEQSLRSIPGDTHPLNKMLYLEAKHFLADHNHNYMDKMSMATGLEVRVPFLDLDLVDLAAQIPPEYKLSGGVGKWVLRKAMDSALPRCVLERDKTGFGTPIRTWFLRGIPTGLDDLISRKTLVRRGLFDPEGVHRLVSMNSRGTADASYILLALMCIELWLQTFVDQPIPRPVSLN